LQDIVEKYVEKPLLNYQRILKAENQPERAYIEHTCKDREIYRNISRNNIYRQEKPGTGFYRPDTPKKG